MPIQIRRMQPGNELDFAEIAPEQFRPAFDAALHDVYADAEARP